MKAGRALSFPATPTKWTPLPYFWFSFSTAKSRISLVLLCWISKRGCMDGFWELRCKRISADFPFSLFTLGIQPPFSLGCCVTKGCRPLSKSYSLVTSVVKQVETLIVSADACLSEKFWALSKGKAGSYALNFKNNL